MTDYLHELIVDKLSHDWLLACTNRRQVITWPITCMY